MATTTVAFTNHGEVHHVFERSLRPRIGSDRNLGSEAALAEPNAVRALRMQVIGDELVVAFQVVSGHVKIYRPVDTLRLPADDVDRLLMPLHQRRQQFGYERLGNNLAERFRRE